MGKSVLYQRRLSLVEKLKKGLLQLCVDFNGIPNNIMDMSNPHEKHKTTLQKFLHLEVLSFNMKI